MSFSAVCPLAAKPLLLESRKVDRKSRDEFPCEFVMHNTDIDEVTIDPLARCTRGFCGRAGRARSRRELCWNWSARLRGHKAIRSCGEVNGLIGRLFG